MPQCNPVALSYKASREPQETSCTLANIEEMRTKKSRI